NAFDAVVVGAGCAGLSAAARLARDGARVLVLEARSRLGGRATAFADRETGELVDNGQHVLLGCYRATLAFLDEIGASSNVRLQDQLRVPFIDRDGRVSHLTCPRLPAPLHLVSGVFGWSALGWRDRFAILRMAGPIRDAQRALRAAHVRLKPDATAVTSSGTPQETVSQWLVRHGQTPRLRELLWEPLALAALNQSPDIAAAAPFARVLAEMFTSSSASAIVLPTKPLHLMYAEPARAFIDARGGSIRTGMRARIAIADGAVHEVRAGGESWPAACVICAVPWFALPDVFAGEVGVLQPLLDHARMTAATPIVTVNLWFDRVVMNEPFVGLPGRMMQWVFDKRVVFGEEASHLSLVSSGAADVLGWTNEQLVEAACRELRGALPLVRDARVLRSTVIREPRATFSLAPGQPARPDTASTPVRGLFLAGDWIGTALPATIEAAVQSGHMAAEAARSTCVR
ncbi:MAG TPA: hydroxysqualene dehydroxylase HpnE, partial [Gemmatimonadaceae bacterium]